MSPSKSEEQRLKQVLHRLWNYTLIMNKKTVQDGYIGLSKVKGVNMFWCKFDIGCDILLNNYISPQVDNKRSRRTTRIKIGELFIILTFRYFCRSVKLLMSLAMYENMEVAS